MPNWKKLIVSGSDATLNSLTVSNGITGSLQGTASWAINALTASYSPNLLISGGITSVDYIQFDTNSNAQIQEARMLWDAGEGTVQMGLGGGNVDLNVGEDLYLYVFNSETASITKGQIVYISGSQGGRAAVKLASAEKERGSASTLGFVAETIAAGSEGWVMTEGVLKKVDTSGYIAGNLIFVSSSAGKYTQTAPAAPLHAVRMGYILKADPTDGAIFVKVDNGYEVGEMHDVIDTTTTSSFGDLFVKSGSVWYSTKQLTGSYGLTGSLAATTINTSFLTASGLNYPATDGQFNGQVLQTNGSGTLSLGNVNALFETIYNAEATQLTKGTLVYISGSQGSNPKAYRADASDPNKMPVTFVVAENINSGTTGRGVTLGLITGINTTAYDVNAILWVNGNGVATQTRPTGSNDII